MASFARRLAGHLRTVGRVVANRLAPPRAPAAERWRGALEDPVAGEVPVTGWLSRAPGAPALVILVHGLGGSADSAYLAAAARVAESLGLASLRLNLRGADPIAGDICHGGLTAELHAAVAAPAFAGYRRIVLLGYSLGGHVVLRYAAEVDDPRVRAAAAACSPLDLAPSASAFDRPSRQIYRSYVLRHLRRRYRDLELAGARLPQPYAVVRRARTLREWDALTVVPRYGFADPADYYARASAARVVEQLQIPALLAVSRVDPMVPPAAVEPFLPAAAAVHAAGRRRPAPSLPPGGGRGSLTVVWHPGGGHVAFPAATNLGVEAPLGLAGQLLGWLRRAAG